MTHSAQGTRFHEEIPARAQPDARFGGLFLVALVGQFFADHNERQAALGQPLPTMGSYLFSADFPVDVVENWQSEYLQFFLFVIATAWLIQRGSTESKPVGTPHSVSDRSG